MAGRALEVVEAQGSEANNPWTSFSGPELIQVSMLKESTLHSDSAVLWGWLEFHLSFLLLYKFATTES
jgi:hypothetical protein